jgi:hypothetical protein
MLDSFMRTLANIAFAGNVSWRHMQCLRRVRASDFSHACEPSPQARAACTLLRL